jgi:hypothetical protein
MWEYLSTYSKAGDANVSFLLFSLKLMIIFFINHRQQLEEINYIIEQILRIIWYH